MKETVKIRADFFELDQVQTVEQEKDGDHALVLYFKLLTIADEEGTVYFTKTIDRVDGLGEDGKETMDALLLLGINGLIDFTPGGTGADFYLVTPQEDLV